MGKENLNELKRSTKILLSLIFALLLGAIIYVCNSVAENATFYGNDFSQYRQIYVPEHSETACAIVDHSAVRDVCIYEECYITYRWKNSLEDVDLNLLKQDFNYAFLQWTLAENFDKDLIEVAEDEHANFEIEFVRIDGPGGVAGYTFLPTCGRSTLPMYFDAEEPYSFGSDTSGVNFRALGLHEGGHGIGLQHSQSLDRAIKEGPTEDVMDPIFDSRKQTLTQNDINRLNKIYE